MNFNTNNMKKRNVLIALFIGLTSLCFAQKKLNVGLGYFGETLSYPGVVGELEYEKVYTEKFSIPLKANIGFYSHPRSHNAMFLDVHEGLRRYFRQGKWYAEQHIGIGLMASFYNEEVWHVDEGGRARTISNFGNIDFMPSVSFGLGYNLTPNRESSNYIWIRPKIFWQLPYNNLALPHLAFQIGYSYNLANK